MPYIPQEDRIDIILGHRDANTKNPGFTTYELYCACIRMLPKKPRFSDYCVLLGALEATKLELYRRHIAPYENERLAEHGDVD